MSDFADEVIRELYPTGGARKCRVLLPDWGDRKIRRRARTLGVRVEVVLPRKIEPDAVDLVIMEHYPSGGSEECQKRLPELSIGAIQSRARRMGISTVIRPTSKRDKEPPGWGSMHHESADLHLMWQQIDRAIPALNDSPLIARIAA